MVTTTNASTGKGAPAESKSERLVRAAEEGDAAKVKDLLRGGTSPDSSAHRQVGEIHESTIRYMGGWTGPVFERGGTAHSDPIEITALQAAAGSGHQEVVELLIKAGASINASASDTLGRTALQAAAEGGHKEITQILLEFGAKDNVPESGYAGRTALQAAAGGGHKEIVQMLLGARENVDAPAPGFYKGTALQAAAGGGHQEIVRVLLEADADADEPASETNGRTALEAAAEGGHEEIVRALLKAGADAGAPVSEDSGEGAALQAAAQSRNERVVKAVLRTGVHAPISRRFGRTALQAAARGGYQGIAQALLRAGANVNAPASVSNGRTALQAAAEGGHEDLVRALLRAGAKVNAPASVYSGRTALQAAAEGGHKKIVQVLLRAGANSNAPASGYKGRTALQVAAERGHMEIAEALVQANADVNCSGERTIFALAATIDLVKLLIKGKGANSDLRNDAGETALHEAVRDDRVNWLESLLDLEFFDMNARNPRGETALHIALQSDSPNSIYAPLLSKGASTEGLVVGMLRKYTDRMVTVVLKDSTTTGGKSVELEWREPLSEYKLPYGEPRSIWLLHSKSQNYHDNTTFFLPGRYIHGIFSPENLEANAVVEFHWMRDRKPPSWSKIDCEAPIPTCGGSKAWLSGYVCFKYPPRLGQSAATDRVTGISWVMNNSSPGSSQLGTHFRSVHFRGSTEDLSIPAHAIGFFTLLLRDARQNWRQLFSDSESVLDRLNRDILKQEGKSTLIRTLLEDGQKCADFRVCLRDHVLESRKLQRRFETDPAFYHEFLAHQDGGQAKLSAQPEDDREGKKAILRLKNQIDALEKECNEGISELEMRTNKMVELEFNLVSINEARKSIDMSHSMKRLSWITFVFLPLMFTASLFGMNVDALEASPSWSWYPVFSVSLLALTFGVWLAFKNMGHLKSKLGNLTLKLGRDESPRASND